MIAFFGLLQHVNVFGTKFQPAEINVTRRLSLFLVVCWMAIPITLAGCQAQSQSNQKESPASSTQKQEVRIVYSKLGALAVMRKQGTLEKRLAPKNFSVKWLEFAAGPQELEALNAGALDIASTAESPPIFAQSAGVPLVYISATPPNGKGVSFLVPANSPVKTIADLKGKKVAFQKASVAHYVLVKALEEVGLKLSDVNSIFLPPPDANVAFSQQKVDAWIIWEPYVTRAEQTKVGRIIRNGEGLKDVGNFYTASRKFAKEHPDVIKVFLEEILKAENWSQKNPHQLAELTSPEVSIDVPTLEKIEAKTEYGLLPINEQVVAKQQQIADMYYNLGLLPKKVNVRDGILAPEDYAAFTPQEVTYNKP